MEKTSRLRYNSKTFQRTQNILSVQGYFGPCPPTGTHRYYFKLYALDSNIDISEKSKKKELQVAIDKHVIQSANLMGKYTKTGK